MPLSMYQASVPVFIHALSNLAAILEKAQAHAVAKKLDPAALLNARLFPDMHPLTRQVQIATDLAKGVSARLADVERPAYEDNEASFEELQARLAKTIAFLHTLKAEQIDGSEERAISLTLRGQDVQFRGQPYLLYFAQPNFYFHCATAYSILRHSGVEIGKQDFIGALQF